MQIVIMAESSKFSGKCVAGINTQTGEWVRLISSHENMYGALLDEDLIDKDGRVINILDVVKVPIIKRCGNKIQPENILIDNSKYMELIGKATLFDVLKIHASEIRNYILGNIYPYITEDKVNVIGHSLTLVKVSNLEILQEKNPFGQPKTKATFYYGKNYYQQMSVTDPRFYSIANHTMYQKAYLVISIGTPYNGKYYKFISGIFIY